MKKQNVHWQKIFVNITKILPFRYEEGNVKDNSFQSNIISLITTN